MEEARVYFGKEGVQASDTVIVFYKGDYSVLYYNNLGVDWSAPEMINVLRRGLKNKGLLSSSRDEFDSRYEYQYTVSFKIEK